MDRLSQIALTQNFTKAGAAAGTTTTVTTTATVQFTIVGKSYSKAAITNQAFPATDHTTGAAFVAVAVSKGCILVLGFDKDGTLGVAQGPVESVDADDNFVLAPQFPAIKETLCPFAYVVCKNGSDGSAWTPGTSNWTATDLTDTFVDVSMLPARPQVA